MIPVRLLALVLLHVPLALGAAEPIAPGDPVPALALETLAGGSTSLDQVRGDGPIVLMVWCSRCPSCRGVEGAFDRFAAEHRGTVPVYALASNPQETIAAVRNRQRQGGLVFPVLLDAAARLADACGVTCTTTILLIAADGTLAYRGPFDREDASVALREVLAGRTPSVRERPQRGCPIR